MLHIRRILIKTHKTVKQVKLKPMKGKVFKLSSLTHYNISVRKNTQDRKHISYEEFIMENVDIFEKNCSEFSRNN